MTDTLSASGSDKLPRGCLIKLQSVYPALKRAERAAADFLLAQSDLVAHNTIADVSENSDCSETTWVRLAKRLGYSGFYELRAELEQYQADPGERGEPRHSALYGDIDAQASPKQVAAKVFASTISALEDTLEMMDEREYERAVDALEGAGTIMLSGVGDASAVARSAYQKLFRTGFNAFASEDQDLQLMGAGRLRPGDVLIAISYSGRTRSVLKLVKLARAHGATTIAITNFPGTPLYKNADITLLTAAFASHVNGEIVSKRATQLCVIESLYVNLLLRLGDKTEDALRRSSEAISLNKL